MRLMAWILILLSIGILLFSFAAVISGVSPYHLVILWAVDSALLLLGVFILLE